MSFRDTGSITFAKTIMQHF